MKKIFFLTVSILIITVVFAKAGNPIPSYNVPVKDKAFFQEDNSNLSCNFPAYAKRQMNVSNNGSPASTGPIIGGSSMVVYIYRLDNSIILGPFAISETQAITVPIDENSWGVYAEATSLTLISVWTDSEQ
ncbi:MAG: hypothetical protein ABSE72_01885 [Bacteroidales bacterium]|jgi:hypothetical protein